MASNQNPNRSNSPHQRAKIPWAWLGLGIVVTLVGLIALIAVLGNFLAQPPEETTVGQGPIIIQLTAPPVPTPTISLNPPTPTIAPTATSAAAPDLSVAPSELTVGYYSQVVDTGGVGVTVRNGPSTANLIVVVAAEGAKLLVLEGPTAGGDYQWWRVRLSDGTEGWAAGDFLTPSVAP